MPNKGKLAPICSMKNDSLRVQHLCCCNKRRTFRLILSGDLPKPRVVKITNGALAQLGERLHGMQEVRGSIPLGSTKFHTLKDNRFKATPCLGHAFQQAVFLEDLVAQDQSDMRNHRRQ